MTDVLGTLAAFDEGAGSLTVVADRDGATVTVALDTVVAGKEVPQRPPRRPPRG